MPWIIHRDQLIGGGPLLEVRSTEAAVIWQLMSANNRQIGRGAEIFASFEGASSRARGVIERCDELMISFVSEPDRGLYGWLAKLDGTPVMTCARWYASDRDRQKSWTLALQAVTRAELGVGTRLAEPAAMRRGSARQQGELV